MTRLLGTRKQPSYVRSPYDAFCEGLSDTCRSWVVAVLCLVRQVSDKPQGRKPRAGLGSAVWFAQSMGI